MDDAPAGAPAYLLIASGLLTVVYSVVYFLWTCIPVAMWAIGSIGSIMDGSNSVVDALVAFFFLSIVPLLQLCGFALTGVMGLLTMFGGLRLNSYSSKGLVWLAILSSTGAPVIALLVNAGSAFNLGSCGLGCITGCLLGNIPTLVLALIGLVATALGAFTLFDPEAQARFDA